MPLQAFRPRVCWKGPASQPSWMSIASHQPLCVSEGPSQISGTSGVKLLPSAEGGLAAFRMLPWLCTGQKSIFTGMHHCTGRTKAASSCPGFVRSTKFKCIECGSASLMVGSLASTLLFTNITKDNVLRTQKDVNRTHLMMQNLRQMNDLACRSCIGQMASLNHAQTPVWFQ